MFNLFPTPTHTLVIKLGKKGSLRMRLFDTKTKKQFGGEIVCLKFGYLKRTIKHIEQTYTIDEVIYLTGDNYERKRQIK